MEDQADGRLSRRSRILLWTLGGLYLAWLLVGLFLVPRLAHEPLVRTLSEVTGKEVRVGDISFNPLGLAVQLDDVAVLGDDGRAMIQVPGFYADFELSSLFRWSLHFDVVEVEQASVLLTRSEQGLNLASLGPAGDGTRGGASEAGGGAIFPVSIGELELSGGRFRYRDETREQPLELTLEPLGVRLEDFTTRGADEEDNGFRVSVTAPDGGTLSWSGRFGLQPFSSSGRLAVEQLALAPLSPLVPEGLALQTSSGRLDMETEYRLAAGQGSGLTLSSGQLRLAALEINTTDETGPGLVWDSLALRDVTLDSDERRLDIGGLSLESPALLVRRLPEGLSVAGLATDGEQGQPTDAASQETEAPWQVHLAEVSVEQGRLRLRDDTLKQPGMLEIAPLNLQAQHLAPGSDRQFRFQGEAGLAGGDGRLGLSGEGTLSPLVAVIKAESDGLALEPLQPWLSEHVRMRLNGGTLSPDLSLTLTDSGGNFSTRITGDLGLSGLDMSQTDGGNRIALNALAVQGLVLDTGIRELVLDQVTLSGLDADAVVNEQGSGVVDQLMVTGQTGEPQQTDAGRQPWSFHLGQFALKSSRLGFRDRSVAPVYRVDLAGMSGGVSDVDTAAGTAGQMRLKAKVDKYAPLSIDGSVDARPGRNRTQMKISLQGYEMTGLTPYTARFLGYKVQSGQLALDTDASLRGSVLESSNRLRADNFYLGESVASEDAVSVPLKVGLAVLRDRDGVVTLPVNISGDLGDPDVSVRGLILKAIGNVLVKAATSPFSVLAGLVGTSEQLDHIPFAAGRDTEAEATMKRLEALAGALAQRPRLQLDLTGVAARADDSRALAMERVAQRTANETGLEWSGLADALAEPSFREAIRESWRLQTGAEADAQPPDDAAGEWPVTRAALRELAAQSEAAVDEQALTRLAAQRAQRAKSLLVGAYGVDAERLFIQDPLIEEGAEPGVRLSLEAP